MTKRNVTITFEHGPEITCEAGSSLHAIYQQHPDLIENLSRPLGALVNNELVSNQYRIETDSKVRVMTYRDSYGQRIFRHTIAFLLAKTVHELYPRADFAVEHALAKGLYCRFGRTPDDGTDDQWIESISQAVRKLVDDNVEIERRKITYETALKQFEAQRQQDKLNLLKYRNPSKVPVYQCGQFMDLAHAPLAGNAGDLVNFQLIAYEEGFIVMGPDRNDPTRFPAFEPAPHMYDVFKGHKEWGRNLDVRTVGDLNERIANRTIDDFIDVNEAYQEKRIVLLASEIAKRREQLKWILIAGPSSSGKTTFSKRLSLQLRASGINAKPISLDNYFVTRDRTPRDANGEPDFEHIETLDLPLLDEHLAALDAGQAVELPYFNFQGGTREYRGEMMQIHENDVIVLEGIHGLNPRLTRSIPTEHKFRIYISALTQLNLDRNNRISTTDNRLIRRMVRDNHFRGHDALKTLSMWPKVRYGEKTWIFPFQKEADVAFNSALDYELSVLRPFAESILAEIKPFHPQYAEACRLQQFLSNFLILPPDHVPGNSVVREFIGSSSFKY